MPTTHRWISTDGNFNAATSYDSGVAPGVKGTGTLTPSAQPADGDTVTLGAITYTFKTTIASAFDVNIGGSQDAAFQNLTKAINLSGVEDTDYKAGTTKNLKAVAVDGGSDTVVVTTTSYANITTTETGANMSWGGATTVNGVVNWATDDKLIFDGGLPFKPPTVNVDSNGDIDLDLIFVYDNVPYDIATAAEPLVINADRIVHLGRGGIHISNDDTGGTIDKITINSADAGSESTIKGGAITVLAVARGNVELKDVDATMIDLVLSYSDSRSSDAKVTVQKTSTAITNVKLSGGRLTLVGVSDITNIFTSNATIRNESTALASSSLHQFSGLVEWNTGITLVLAAIMDGLLDFTKSSHEKVITTFYLFPNARFNYFPDLTTASPISFDGLKEATG